MSSGRFIAHAVDKRVETPFARTHMSAYPPLLGLLVYICSCRSAYDIVVACSLARLSTGAWTCGEPSSPTRPDALLFVRRTSTKPHFFLTSAQFSLLQVTLLRATSIPCSLFFSQTIFTGFKALIVSTLPLSSPVHPSCPECSLPRDS